MHAEVALTLLLVCRFFLAAASVNTTKSLQAVGYKNTYESELAVNMCHVFWEFNVCSYGSVVPGIHEAYFHV